jgi:hypothetical protein
MDSRIEKLKQKYWAGETSLAEEKELKEFFSKNPSLTGEGKYFARIEKDKKQLYKQSFSHPGRRNYSMWWSAAAVILILLTFGIFSLQDTQTSDPYAVEDPREALEITRASLMKVSEGLNKGKIYSQELDRINKAKESITY